MQLQKIASKILALLVIVALLGMRLSTFTADMFITPVEDAIFDTAYIVADDDSCTGKLLKAKTKRGFDILLHPTEELGRQYESPQAIAKPSTSVLQLKGILSEIFIPPEIIS